MKGKIMKKLVAVMLASILIAGTGVCSAFAADSQPHYTTVKTLSPEEANLLRLKNMYLNYIEYCLRQNWKNPVSNNYQAGFKVNIDKNGRMTSYDILNKSKSTEFENAALQTIGKTAPFKPMPVELKMNGCNVDIIFSGQDIQATNITTSKHLKNKVSQNNKICRTVEIEESKQLAIQSEYPQFVSGAVHTEISRQIMQNWKPYLKNNNIVAVSFKISSNGTMQNIKVEVNQTQNADAADAAINAIKSIKLSNVPDSSVGATIVYYFGVGENQGF